MDWQHLTWLDYFIIGIVALSMIISLVRGFVREALSLASWIIAFWVAFTFTAAFSNHLSSYITENTMRLAVSFFILFAATLLIGAMVNFLVTQIVDKTGLSGTDRMIGVIFGFGRGVLLMALLLLAARLTPLPQQPAWKASQLVASLAPFEHWLINYLPEKFQTDLVLKQKQYAQANEEEQSAQALKPKSPAIETSAAEQKTQNDQLANQENSLAQP